jgi:hypothetical protein
MINKILVPQDQRPTAAEILQHPWLAKADQKGSESSTLSAFENLKTFRADRKL